MKLPQSNRLSLSVLALIAIFLLAAIPSMARQQTLLPSLSNVRFGKVAVGTSESQVLNVTNPGATGVTVSSVSVTGSEFSVSGVQLPVSIGAGQTISLSVTFTPSINGWMSEQITLSDNSSNSVLQIIAAGNGVNSQALTASPSGLSFGSVALGSTVALPVVLTNSRSWDQTINAFQTSGSGFSIKAPALPLVLTAGQSVTVNISFSPQSSGLIGGSVFVSGPNTNVPLVGTGVSSVAGTLTVSPTSLSFGSVNIGTSTTQASSLSATGGRITISAETNNNPQFQVTGISLPVTIAAGQTLAFNVVFSPTQSGLTSGSLVFASNASNAQSTSVPLAGTGVSSAAGKLIVSPTSLSFGSVNVGSSTTQPSSLSATGGSVTISAETNNNPQFQITGISLPVTIAAGQTLPFAVVFSPTQSGSTSGSLVFASNATNAQSTSVPLAGTGVSSVAAKLIVSPTSLSFGSVNVGSSTTQPSSLSATGGNVTISAETNNNPQFQITGVSLPVTIPAGQTVGFDVVFSPTQSGSTSGSLVFASNATNAQSTEAVSGSGVAVQKIVNLSWNASTSAVSGYNVYRGSSIGAYSKINSSMDPSTSFTDSTIVSGATYYYAATAVNSSGQESGYSAAIKVAVP